MKPIFEKKVVHVDDDPAISRIVERVLTKRGYTVYSVNDPSLAIQRIKETSSRLVFLDIDMPDKNGLELLKEIKKLDGCIQVVMLTGMVSMGTILRATRFGAEECLFKPIEDFEELGDAADRVYAKIMRWWDTLRKWKARKKVAMQAPQLLEQSYPTGETNPIIPTDIASACSVFITSDFGIVSR